MAQRFPTLNSRNFLGTTQIESAISFADSGLPVFPVYGPTDQGCQCSKGIDCPNAGKHPMTKHGFKDATTRREDVSRWWQQAPDANLGLLTGKDSGLVVLDVDPRHGGDKSLAQLEAEYGKLPETLKVRTGGDGWHYYFLHPGHKITNKTDIRPGLDFRGDGGYIIAPPSVHRSKKRYEWDGESENPAPLPEWLLNLMGSTKPDTAPQGVSALFGSGSRNSSLLSVGGFLKSKGMEQGQLITTLQSLNQAVCNPPLESQEVQQIANSLGRYTEEPWPEPQPLPEPAKSQVLDASLLPDPLKDWTYDISERMQVPLEFVAGPAIVMLAGLIGRKAVIYPKQNDNWRVCPNLWGMLISPPGSLKSPTLGAVLGPLQKLAIKAREEFLEEQKRQQEQEVVAKTEIDALKDSLKKAVKEGKPDVIAQKKELLEVAVRNYEENNKATERRYIANDPTSEKLLSIIEENPQGILLFRDELSGWLETMYKSGREGDREFFLEAWNGDSPFAMDRIGRGTTFVEGLCLSVLGGLQPSKFGEYIASVAKGGKSDDGLLQRFQILMFPERRRSWKKIDRYPNEEAARNLERVISVLDSLPCPERSDDGVARLELRFDEEAQEIADQWHEELEYRLLPGNLSPIFEAHLGKFRSLMPSLALIFSLVAKANEEGGSPKSVGVDSVKLAIAWCSFLESHARRAYGEYLEPEKSAARFLLAKIEKKSVRDYDKPRDLYRKRWKGLSSAEEFDAALNVLAESGWVRLDTISSESGRNNEVIRLHPSLRAS